MLGTAYQDFESLPAVLAQILSRRSFYLSLCDLYIPHPREVIDKQIAVSSMIFRISSPVEAVIGYLASKSCLQAAYHFGSTAARFAEQFEGLQVIDILP